MLKPNPKRAEKLVMEMMAVPGRWSEEALIAGFILQQLKKAGVPASAIARDNAHKKSPFGGQCGNLIVKLPGSAGREKEARRLLMAHMDTVPLCVGSKPVKKGGIVKSANPKTALGGDDRSGSAAILTALLEVVEKKLPHSPLTFLWCIQEEVGLCGARYVDVNKLGGPRLAFNFDGGDPALLTIGATGAYRMNIHVSGIASHAGMHPERGVSATAVASLAIADLQKNGWHGLIRKHGIRGTSNVGVIKGGDATNVVTDSLTIRAEARSHNHKLRQRIVDEYQKAFVRAVKQVKNEVGQRGSVAFEMTHDYESFALDRNEPCVAAARGVVEGMGLTPDYRIANGGLDANWMNDQGIPTVTLGCGQHSIHMTSEYLDLREFHGGCVLALNLAVA